MNQYCRYCSNLVTENGVWCMKKEREYREATTKTTNHCAAFLFNPIDAFETNERGYHPRIVRQEQCEGQLSFLV